MTDDPNIRVIREAMADYDHRAEQLRERMRKFTQEMNEKLPVPTGGYHVLTS